MGKNFLADLKTPAARTAADQNKIILSMEKILSIPLGSSYCGLGTWPAKVYVPSVETARKPEHLGPWKQVS